MEARPLRVGLVLLTLAVLSLTHSPSYSLSADQCKEAVRTIGKATKTEMSTNPVVRGTWVSPRCEVRRVQDPSDSNGGKTAFLLRNFDIQKGKRWSGHYFFYKDKDCMVPAYGLQFAGRAAVGAKGNNISFNFNTLKIATYTKDADKMLQRIYNRSCPGAMKLALSKNANLNVYNADRGVDGECVKALGVGIEEFNGAYIQSHSLKRKKVVGLLLPSVNLRKGSSHKASKTFQWALGRHTSTCLTCTKLQMSSIGHPPKLLARNASSVDGAWASSRCRLEGDVYVSRFDKFAGKKFENSVFVYYSSLCIVPDLKLNTMGTIQRVSDSVEVPGGVVYKMTVKNADLTSYLGSVTRILSGNKGNCGGQEWTTGKSQDLMPTNGCDVIGSHFGGPELVLIRTVHDENHNELYFGIDSSTNRHKSGPVDYNYVSQDCNSFPVDVPTPSTTTEVPTAPLTWPTRANTLPLKNEVKLVGRIPRTIPPSGGAPLVGVKPSSLLCCLVVFVLAAVKFV